MGLEGNLKDMSLPSIMQILCLEQRNVGLSLLRGEERGQIMFDRGEVVHATSGAMEGEEAVFYLLSWSDGRFRTSNDAAVNKRSVNMRWDQLLLEGMRRLDEWERNSETLGPVKARALTEADIARDSELENEVLLLLSHLEQLQSRLMEQQARKKHPVVLETLADMANQIVGVLEETVAGNDNAAALKNMLTKVTEEHSASQLLQAQGNRLNGQSLVNVYKSATFWQRGPVFRELSSSAIGVIDSYFTLLTSSFRSVTVTEEIKDAYGLFLNDLTRVVDEFNS